MMTGNNGGGSIPARSGENSLPSTARYRKKLHAHSSTSCQPCCCACCVPNGGGGGLLELEVINPFTSFHLLLARRGLAMSCKRAADPIEGATSSAQLRAEGGRRRRMEEAGRKQGMSSFSPCAACKLLRRRCVEDCLFAPHFSADEPRKFANVHKVFGASNVGKLLQEIAVQHRSDAASSLVYEADARISDAVYGCVGEISSLQSQIQVLQAQLAVVQAKLFHLRTGHAAYLARHGGVSRSPAATESSCSGGSSFASSPGRNRLAVAAAKLHYGMDMVLQEETNSREPPISSC